jgi:hypothetical protein
MSEKDSIEITEEAKKPGTFSIVNALKDRAYPQDEVNVYLDEETAYKASQAKQVLSKIDSLDVEYAAAEEKFNKLMDKLQESKYVFHIKGISEGKREEIFNLSVQKYPAEFNETKNAFTGEVKKEEIESVDRNNLFTAMIWAAHILKIVAPDGSVQGDLMPEDAAELRTSLPIASSALVNRSIEKVREASALFMMTVDEDFLAKS